MSRASLITGLIWLLNFVVIAFAFGTAYLIRETGVWLALAILVVGTTFHLWYRRRYGHWL